MRKNKDFNVRNSRSFRLQVRKLASVCGKISSLENCVGNITRLMTRNTFVVVTSVTNQNSLVSLPPECINELNFWKDNLATINGVPLQPVKRKPTKIVYSDVQLVRKQSPHVICGNPNKQINILPARIRGLGTGARGAETYGIVVCKQRSLVGQDILRSAFALLICSFSISFLSKCRAVLAYYLK